MIIRFKWFWIMGALTVPWMLIYFVDIKVFSVTQAFLSGIAIMAAAFILTWAAEAAEHDFSGPLILTLLALIAVLPEYAIDATLAWKAGMDKSFAPYAVANMTGANRLLVGIGWAIVIFVYWFKTKNKSVGIPENQRIDCAILAIASIYAFTIPWKGFLSWFDTCILLLLFGFYLYKVMNHEAEEIEPVGPAKVITALSTKTRRVAVSGIFVAYAAFAIYVSAEPFTHGLIETGEMLGVEKFLLVQWLAPLASESPEFIIAILFALRLRAQKGLGLLVASEVNQLTLLVGSIPFFFIMARGSVARFPLDPRQSQEITLTAAQSLFAVVLLANLNLSLWEAGLLVVLFVAQLLLPSYHGVFIGIYLFAAVAFLIGRRRESLRAWRAIARELLPKKRQGGGR